MDSLDCLHDVPIYLYYALCFMLIEHSVSHEPISVLINMYIYIYIYIYDSQIVHENFCFNLFILHNDSFDNQGSEINKNDVFLRFDILSFTKNSFLLHIQLYIYILLS